MIPPLSSRRVSKFLNREMLRGMLPSRMQSSPEQEKERHSANWFVHSAADRQDQTHIGYVPLSEQETFQGMHPPGPEDQYCHPWIGKVEIID